MDRYCYVCKNILVGQQRKHCSVKCTKEWARIKKFYELNWVGFTGKRLTYDLNYTFEDEEVITVKPSEYYYG